MTLSYFQLRDPFNSKKRNDDAIRYLTSSFQKRHTIWKQISQTEMSTKTNVYKILIGSKTACNTVRANKEYVNNPQKKS